VGDDGQHARGSGVVGKRGRDAQIGLLISQFARVTCISKSIRTAV
jgi:hypothetical protein